MSTQSITNIELVVLTILLMFVCIIGMLEAGRWIGIRDRAKDSRAEKGLGPMEGAMFGLLGLLIAFTFSGAATRFDMHRELIVKETNAIGAAYLSIDLLPEADQAVLRQNFRDYLEARLAYYRHLNGDPVLAVQNAERARHLQMAIWNAGVASTRQSHSEAVTSLVLQAIGNMIDITTDRMMAQQMHPPVTVYVMMGTLILVCSLLAGYEIAFRRKRSWVHQIGFAAIIAASLFVIIDFEYPRIGLIRVDMADHFLVDLLSRMQR